jgi:predicted alpha/beta-fold hydrolase
MRRSSFCASRPFVPARGLRGGHAQTLFPVFFRPGLVHRWVDAPPLRRERWTTPDADFVDVDRLEGAKGAPCVILLHGLEGSSGSGYVMECLRLLNRLGVGALALNFRSCSGEPNRTCAAYSSGDLRDVHLCMARLDEEGHEGTRHLIGFSLGGNVTLKFLANATEAGRITSAAAVSVPFDLDACVTRIDEQGGMNHIYRERFLRPMKAKALAKAARFTGQLDADAIRRARTLREFDHHVTAPTFGFASAEDYYARASSGPDVHRITTPTLLITSEDDPLAPAAHLAEHANGNDALTILRTERGGHVGFVEGSITAPRYWAEEQAVRFVCGDSSGAGEAALA